MNLCLAAFTIDHHLLALVSIAGLALGVLGSLYLAYDLLGHTSGVLHFFTVGSTFALAGAAFMVVLYVILIATPYEAHHLATTPSFYIALLFGAAAGLAGGSVPLFTRYITKTREARANLFAEIRNAVREEHAALHETRLLIRTANVKYRDMEAEVRERVLDGLRAKGASKRDDARARRLVTVETWKVWASQRIFVMRSKLRILRFQVRLIRLRWGLPMRYSPYSILQAIAIVSILAIGGFGVGAWAGWFMPHHSLMTVLGQGTWVAASLGGAQVLYLLLYVVLIYTSSHQWRNAVLVDGKPPLFAFIPCLMGVAYTACPIVLILALGGHEPSSALLKQDCILAVAGGIAGGIAFRTLWWVDTLKERQLGIIGIFLIMVAFIVQLIPPLISLLDIPVH